MRTTCVVPSERCTRASTSITVADRPPMAISRPLRPPSQRIVERSDIAAPVVVRRGNPSVPQLSGHIGAMARLRSPRAGTFHNVSHVSVPVCCSSR